MYRQIPQICSVASRPWRIIGLGLTRHHSTLKASSSLSNHSSRNVVLPYFIGGVSSVAAVGLGSKHAPYQPSRDMCPLTRRPSTVYGYYYFSGMKQVADKLAAAKDRYDNARAVAAEKRGVAREQIKSMKDVVKGKTASIREVWAPRNKDDDGVRIRWLLKRTQIGRAHV